MSEKVTVRVAGFTDLIAIERVIIGAKQHRVSEKLSARRIKSVILLGIGIMRMVNHLIDSLGARAIGQKYHHYTLVAEVQGRIIGACTINTALGRDPLVWFLGPIAVDDSFRGRGIGTLLVTKAISYVQMHKGTSIVLSVASDNAAAISLYTKCGFRETDADKAMIYEFQRQN
jgi:ribosomal protein S18 acetylase RimI-like enzyme